MSSAKRKRTVLPVKGKQAIIRRLEKGEKAADLVSEYGVSRQQISDIRKSREKIMKFVDNMESDKGLKRKSLKVVSAENGRRSDFGTNSPGKGKTISRAIEREHRGGKSYIGWMAGEVQESSRD